MLMLNMVTFHLSGKFVALCLDNNTAAAYFVIKVLQYLSFETSLLHLNLADNHVIDVISSYMPTHFSVKASYH